MDILIKNGLVIDGTGSPGYKADILIKGEKIEKIGLNLESNDYEVIDASNKVIAPGFIDMHSHADLTILELNKAEAAIMQGVTTLVVGMCGIGLAPTSDILRFYYKNFISNMFGSSNLQLYDTLQDYIDLLDKKGISTNLAFFIPHGNVRGSILGMEDRPATVEELKLMKKIVRRGMETGAFGLTTGLIYPPGIVTPTEELIELSKVVSEYNGIYDSHVRNEGTGVVDVGMKEIKEIAREAKIQVHISHWKAAGSVAWNLTPNMINFVKNAQNEGLNIHADLYPYNENSTSLSLWLLNSWVYDNFKENLTNLKNRRKIIDEIFEKFISNNLPTRLENTSESMIKKGILGFLKQNVRILSVLYNHEIEGLKLGKALEILYPKKNPVEALLDFIRDEENSIMVSIKSLSERKSIFHLFKQDFVCVGSDGILNLKGNTHPRSYGTFARILSKYVREKKLVSLEEGIRKMTSLPAAILGLNERGVIKENYKADIVIFDPQEIKDNATYKDGRQYPEGVYYVIVNGITTVANGKHLGVLNGQILKHLKI